MVLVDANVLIDVLTDDPQWREWSEDRLLTVAGEDELAINPIIYAELAVAYRTPAELDRTLRGFDLHRLLLPYEAGFLAGQVFMAYRKRDGKKRSPLPDFYIGAHAQVENLRLLTRDATRYRTYFPKVALIAP